MYPYEFDFRKPEYVKVFQWRIDKLAELRQKPELIPILKAYYRENPIDFIEDWGVTADPRNVDRNLPVVMPLLLFQRQKEFVEWMRRMWQERKPGVSDKSRDMGLSWSAVAFASWAVLFHDGFIFGFGSRKAELVDKSGDPDCLFYKIRTFLSYIPDEFRGGWNETKYQHSSHMKIMIPRTGSVIRGEGGDNIGRGGRASIYVVDEAAHLERPRLIDAALSANTNCRIDISSVNGRDNPFAEKRFKYPSDQIFTAHWRDDPRKDEAWYEKMCELHNPLVIAQEVDIGYDASKEGILIPAVWVQAAVDAHLRLNFEPSGIRAGALDVADEGIDLNAWASRHGVVLTHVHAWSGKGSDIFQTVQQAFMLADQLNCPEFQYDADGLGAGVRGDAKQINDRPDRANCKREALPFRGSGEVTNPDVEIIKGDNKAKGRTNKDFFANRKAQAWWALRTRFQNTYRAVIQGLPYVADDLISIPSQLPERGKLIAELSQPTYSINNAGKILVDKAPDGQRSPNYADAVMILMAPQEVKKRSYFG